MRDNARQRELPLRRRTGLADAAQTNAPVPGPGAVPRTAPIPGNQAMQRLAQGGQLPPQPSSLGLPA
jgi:hypothetical protein